MNKLNLYLARFSFIVINDPNKRCIYFSYCIEASNDKFAYQKALIIASEKYYELNLEGDYSFNKLDTLTLINSQSEANSKVNIIYNTVDEICFGRI
jgi:hypothetical protein